MGKAVLAIMFAFAASPLLFPLAMSESRVPASIKSKRVLRILNEAQDGERPIRIEEFDGGGESQYTGMTDFNPSEIVVRVARRLPPRTGENNLVHELFHIILFKEGFRYDVVSSGFNLPGDAGKFYLAVATRIGNCYVDPIVDRRMAHGGFEPDLVSQLTADGLGSVEKSRIQWSIQVDPRFIEFFAMGLYCLSLRPGRFKMEDVQKNWSVNPSILEKAMQFRKQLSSACDTPNDCLERMKSLRSAAGFGASILFMNRLTGEYE